VQKLKSSLVVGWRKQHRWVVKTLYLLVYAKHYSIHYSIGHIFKAFLGHDKLFVVWQGALTISESVPQRKIKVAVHDSVLTRLVAKLTTAK
jgi:hypothetical protein